MQLHAIKFHNDCMSSIELPNEKDLWTTQ